MSRHPLLLFAGLAFVLAASAAELPPNARIGVVDGLPPRLSAGFGSALERHPAPTVRDEWQLGAVARSQAVERLAERGYRVSSATLPAALVEQVRRGGALVVGSLDVRLDTRFARALGRWMRAQQLAGVLVLRTQPVALAPGAPMESGHGIAARGDDSLAYANLAPLLITDAAAPAIHAAPRCLVTASLQRPTGQSALARATRPGRAGGGRGAAQGGGWRPDPRRGDAGRGGLRMSAAPRAAPHVAA